MYFFSPISACAPCSKLYRLLDQVELMLFAVLKEIVDYIENEGATG